MLRNDVKHMLQIDYEPKIPNKESILKQTKKYKNRISGCVSLSLGKIATR